MISSEALSDKYLHVNNCGRQSLGDSNYNTLRLHGRIDYHLLYIISGKCHAEVGGAEHVAKAGYAILFRPGEKQKYAFYKADASESLWIHFTGVGCEEYLRRLGLYDRACFEVGSSPKLLSVLDSMVLARGLAMSSDVSEPNPDSEICDGYLTLALALMAKAASAAPTRSKHAEEITAAAEEMNRTFKENRPISDFAALCHMSLSRFEHVFKETVGISPKGYITSLRLEHAKRLLETTDLAINRIAEASGTDDANYFTRLFKKRFGMTPKELRNRSL